MLAKKNCQCHEQPLNRQKLTDFASFRKAPPDPPGLPNPPDVVKCPVLWLVDFLTISGHDRHLLKTIRPFRGPVGVRLQESPLNQLLLEDCIAGLGKQPAGSVDLAFADPPFNIGYTYDVYADSKESQQYLAWCEEWIAAVYRALKPDGTFWLAIGDEYAAELKVAAQKIGFHTRSWVVWYYTFGVNCKFKFTRSHAHIFYFVKDREKFTFNSEDPANRIPSARQLVYADKRANPKGRLPDDTWIIPPTVEEMARQTSATWVLRPQDLADRFTPTEDTWYFPRVAGTFKEREGFHGCQMPEQLLGRIIRMCSHPGELVLDPFSGSATTLAVAKKLGRKYLGFDISEQYVTHGLKRLESIEPGDPLDGAAEPTMSAPSTAKGKQRKSLL